ncbi:hypothetical protein HDU78_009714 [Chytriomyces hyalinus]|nr:hypothetical protein HDU78_009714 [Chytriomyces hyalinus]
MSSKYHLVVYGAGLVGGYISGMVAASKEADVTLVCRDTLAKAIANNGNLLQATKCFDAKGKPVASRETVSAKVESPSLNIVSDPMASGGGLLAVKARGVPVQCLLVTMKRISVQTALLELKSAGFDEETRDREGEAWFWKGTTVVMMQNGVTPSQLLLDTLGKSLNVIDAMFPFNVTHAENNPAQFIEGSTGTVYISDTPQGQQLAQLLTKAGIETATHHDMAAIQYGKLFLNLNNAVSALSGEPLKKELSQFQYRNVLSRCMNEALAVFAKAGIKPHSFTGMPFSAISLFMVSPDFIFNNTFGLVMGIGDSATSSMYEDLVVKRDTEIDFLQGHIAELGRLHGVPTPTCDRIVALVKDIQQRKVGLVPHTGQEILSML